MMAIFVTMASNGFRDVFYVFVKKIVLDKVFIINRFSPMAFSFIVGIMCVTASIKVAFSRPINMDFLFE